MLVQELMAIQERCGYLPKEEMRALARRVQAPMHRVHEVASYYPHFRLEPSPRVSVRVCRDQTCHLRGSERLRRTLESFAEEMAPDRIKVDGVSCLGRCDSAPLAVSVNDHVCWGLGEAELRNKMRDALESQELRHQRGERGSLGWQIDPYGGKPGYEAVKRFVASRDADSILKALEAANLRGMGGAGFPTARKWSAVRSAGADVKYVVCNADESEPGTFKDRELLRRTPHLVIEGMVLAGLVTGACRGTLYIRHEYHDELEAFREELTRAHQATICGANILGSGQSFTVDVFVSPGGYVQGEETALLEAMEDRRGEPRNKPPFPTAEGLFSKPTVINNVETLSWVPSIVLKGGEWYRDQGVNGATGLRFVSISGDVQRPGVYEVPFGQTVRDLIFSTAGGMLHGQALQAVAPSGPSGGFLPAVLPTAALPARLAEKLPPGASGMDLLDVTLDLKTLGEIGSMLGAAFVVYGDRADMVEQALRCVEFFRNESCGKCVPCRLGSEKLVRIIQEMLAGRGSRAQLPVIGELSQTMTLASICGLGQVAANPMATIIKYFPQQLARYLRS